MIRLESSDELMVLILEPGNLKRLRQGDPIVLDPDETGLGRTIAIAFAPDVEWLAGKIKTSVPMDARNLSRLLVEGLSRPEIDRTKAQ